MEINLPHEWTPRAYQEPTWNYLRGPAPRKRAVFVCHRRGGKDLLAVNQIACSAFERIGAYWHLFPEFKQARAAIWNGITSEGEPGNEGRKGTKFLDHIPSELIDRTYENEMRIKLVNGSNYYLVGSDNYDGLVGTNPVGIVLSEYSLQDPRAWHYLSPILAENGGWALFIYTFRGRNHGWFLAQQAKKNPEWFYDEQKAGSGPDCTKKPDGTPVVTDEEIERLRAEGTPESIIQSEYFNNPDAPLDGAYYERQMAEMKRDGRICAVPWEPKLPVQTAWDLGVGDMTVIIFYQVVRSEVRIIDLAYNTGEFMPYYAKLVKEKPYVYETHHAPWDVDVADMKSAGKSITDVGRSLGINFKSTPQKPGNMGVLDGIEQVRSLLGKVWIDAGKCSMLIEALRSYTKEEEAEKMQFTGEAGTMQKMFKTKPKHDWASHFADAMRCLAWNYKERVTIDISKLPRRASACSPPV